MDVFLFLTRPSIWVYNRLIVIFLTFYVFWYVFGVGPLCSSQCKLNEVAAVSNIGVHTFTLPFKNPLYLFQWESFDLSHHKGANDKQFAVIQQVLIFTTIFGMFYIISLYIFFFITETRTCNIYISPYIYIYI